MTTTMIGLEDIAAISTAEEGRAVALALYNQLQAANETLESDYYAIKRELSCRDGQIAKMRNQLDDIQRQHEGVSMRLGPGSKCNSITR